VTPIAVLTILCAALPQAAAGGPPDAAASSRAYDVLVQLNPHLRSDGPAEFRLKMHSLHRGPNDFFRGSAELYYDWCRRHCTDWLSDRRSVVLLHGDVHPGNTGTFRAPDERGDLCYSLVDLDETFRGPFQLDLLRAMLSLRFAAAENDLSISEGNWDRLGGHLCRSYAGAIDAGIPDSTLRQSFEIVRVLMDEAAKEKAEDYFDRFTQTTEAGRRFRRVVQKRKSASDFLDPIESETRKNLSTALLDVFGPAADAAHSHFPTRKSLETAILDMARWTRIGSSGSQGVAKYLVLLRLPGGDGNGDLRMLQFKEQPVPAAARAGLLEPQDNRAALVAAAHGTLQCHPSKWIAGVNVDGRQFLITPKSPWAEEPSLKDLRKLRDIEEMASLLGTLLGRGHGASIKNADARTAVKAAAGELPTSLAQRGAEAFDDLNELYDELKRDERFLKAVQEAATFVETRSAPRRS